MGYKTYLIGDEKMEDIKESLGVTYTPEKTTFKVWAPHRNKIDLLIYEGQQEVHREKFKMNKENNGVFQSVLKEDLKGKYYTFLVEDTYEVTDPYSVASSINSIRSAIIDLKDTNPKGWESHKIPNIKSFSKAIIYEMHVKDFTFHSNSGVEHRGKYLGVCEEGTYNGIPTAIDHLKDLGITHVHLMPIFDFISVKEEKEYFYKDENYNWGYEPELYNVPEGSYSLEPKDPTSRIVELKTMIMKLHEAGIKVIMDVVYNHTYRFEDSNFNILNPGYYYRIREDGSYSNGSGCGNEMATERAMVRKFMMDSLEYWVKEYKIDGFRFDLMALIDIDTVEEIVKNLRSIKEDIIIYGEPWSSGITVLPSNKTTTKGTQEGKGFALLNDEFRNAIKGDNNGYHKGFSQGNNNYMLATETGIVGSIHYDSTHNGFAHSPTESINYVNSHDNLILYDKMKKTFPSSSEEEIVKHNKFALSILFTSQGIPLIHAGNEFLRGKQMDHNSYNSPLSINAIDWFLKEKNLDFYKYFKDLIKLRKSYSEFTMEKAEDIKAKIKFIYMREQNNFIGYTISLKEDNKYLLILHNGNSCNFNLSMAAMKSHLSENYSIVAGEMNLKEILDQKGLIENNKIIKNPEKLEVENYSTSIYEITNIKN